MTIKFTGIDTPIGGISWENCDSERDKAKRLLEFLCGRRILTNDCRIGCKNCLEYSSRSLLKIRDALENLLSVTKDKEYFDTDIRDDYIGCIRRMRQVCNNSLNDFNDPMCKKLVLSKSQSSNRHLCPIMKFRNEFVFNIGVLIFMFDIVINSDIARLLLMSDFIRKHTPWSDGNLSQHSPIGIGLYVSFVPADEELYLNNVIFKEIIRDSILKRVEESKS